MLPRSRLPQLKQPSNLSLPLNRVQHRGESFSPDATIFSPEGRHGYRPRRPLFSFFFNLMRSLESYADDARKLRAMGYNCAQCVLMPFDDVTGLDRGLAARLASGLGAGLGAKGEICGVINAMAIAQGFDKGEAPSDKVASMKCAGGLASQFASCTGGRLRCADLKQEGAAMSCDALIMKGIEILHAHFAEQYGA